MAVFASCLAGGELALRMTLAALAVLVDAEVETGQRKLGLLLMIEGELARTSLHVTVLAADRLHQAAVSLLMAAGALRSPRDDELLLLTTVAVLAIERLVFACEREAGELKMVDVELLRAALSMTAFADCLAESSLV